LGELPNPFGNGGDYFPKKPRGVGGIIGEIPHPPFGRRDF